MRDIEGLFDSHFSKRRLFETLEYEFFQRVHGLRTIDDAQVAHTEPEEMTITAIHFLVVEYCLGSSTASRVSTR